MSDVSKSRPADRVLAEFGEAIEIPDLVLDDKDRCFLSIRDAVIELRLIEDTGRLLLRSIVAALPARMTPGFFGTVLAVNHVSAGHGRGFLSLDAEAGGLVWNSELALFSGMTGANLLQAVSDADGDIAFWSREIDALIEADDSSTAESRSPEGTSVDEHFIFRA